MESRKLQPLCICSHQVTWCMVAPDHLCRGGRLSERTPRTSDLEASLRFLLLALLDDFGIALDSGTICISRTVVLHASSATLPELAGTGLPVSTVFFAHTTTICGSALTKLSGQRKIWQGCQALSCNETSSASKVSRSVTVNTCVARFQCRAYKTW